MDSKQRPTIIGNIPKLPAKWALVIVPFILSCLMSGIISMINMLRNLGWIEGFMALWFHNWMISWAIAFPIVVTLLPLYANLPACWSICQEISHPNNCFLSMRIKKEVLEGKSIH